MNIKKQSAGIIKEQRKKYGYSHDEVAAWIGKERSVYTRKENGKIPFSADEFLFILEELERRGPKSQHKALSLIVKNFKLLK